MTVTAGAAARTLSSTARHRVEHVLAAVEHDHAALLGQPDRGRVDRLEPEGVGDRGRVGSGRQGGEATRRDRSGQVADDVSDES